MASSAIHIRGSQSSLGRSLISRLIRANVKVALPAIDYHWAKGLFATELSYSSAELLEENPDSIDSGSRILFLGHEHFLAQDSVEATNESREIILVTAGFDDRDIDTSNVNSHITVSHVLPNQLEPTWCCPLLIEWYQALINGCDIADDSRPKHWWVSQMDVVDAIARLLLSEQTFAADINICGRRAWSTNQTVEEMKMLYSRSIAGQSGSFGAQHLINPPTPTIEVEQLGDINDEQFQRPDLDTLHRLLVECDGDGWRPMMPIRSAIMMFLAGAIEPTE